MKRTVLLFLALASMFSACNNDKREVRRVAKGYLEATANYDISAAEPFASKETREETLPFLKKLIVLTDTAYIASNTPATITIDSIKMLQDTAYVYYTKNTPIQTASNKLCVINEEGKWVADAILRQNIPLKSFIDTVSISD